MDRSRRVDYALQCERLKALSEQWQPRQIIAEQNSMGQPIIEQLTRDGLRIQPFTTSQASKAQAIECLALAFERGDIRILNDAVLIGELVAYQAERLPSGLLRYGAPGGQHDDTVMALAMAWSAVSSQRRVVYPVPDSVMVVKDFAIPEHWPRAYGLDLRWHTAAAIWGARDPASDVLYLYSEYLEEGESANHVVAIRGRGEWIPGLVDAVANGRSPADASRLTQIYRKLGLNLQTIDNPLESGVLDVWQRMQSGGLKVFASLSKYLDERRVYLRDEKDEIVRERDHLQDAVRCLVNGICRLRTKPVKVSVPPRRHYGERSWMA
jgi:Terminase RNaseH-like domain